MIQANYYPPNGYPYTTCKDLRGTSDDTKPSDVPEGSTFHEWDTGNEYMFDGSDWLLQTSGGGGGGGFGDLTPLMFSDGTGGDEPSMVPFNINSITGVLSDTFMGEGVAIAANDGMIVLASGAEITVRRSDGGSWATTKTIALYDLDMDTYTETLLPDTVTPLVVSNALLGGTFTMPTVESGHAVELMVTTG